MQIKYFNYKKKKTHHRETIKGLKEFQGKDTITIFFLKKEYLRTYQ